MILKKIDKTGEKYYINAFTGKMVVFEKYNPLVKEPDPKIQQLMKPKIKTMFFGAETKAKKDNDRKSHFVGEFKMVLKQLKKEGIANIDKSQFIRICKRVNVNPYPLINC
jgi:hypothetical protein